MPSEENFEAEIAWGDGTVEPAGDITLVETPGGEGALTTGTIQAEHAYGDNGVYTVTVRVRDDDMAAIDPDWWIESFFDVYVDNVLPGITPMDDLTEILEGQFISLPPATFSDPGFDNSAGGTAEDFTATIDWGDGHSEPGVDITLVEVAGAEGVLTTGTVQATHAYADDGTYTVKLTVYDDNGGSVDSFFDVFVANVDPTIDEESLFNTSPGCGDVVEGSPVEVAVSFSDPGFDNPAGGTIEDFTSSTIDWGDGTPVESWPAINVDETPGAEGLETTGTISGTHVYEDGGVYTVTITVCDDDGGMDTIETQVIITGAGIHNGVLQIIGTAGDDNVSVNQTGNGVVKVHAEFLPGDEDVKTFSLDQVDTIWMVLCYGDDQATISGKVEKTAIIDGGPGNDHLNGGGGSNILLGGAGDDMLIGGDARDIFIGGAGADRLVANPGEDILIGGGTIYDAGPGRGPLANDVALLALLDAWNDPDLDFVERQANLQDLYGIDLEGLVEDDDEEDVLTGASGEDWFIFGEGDTATDASSNNGGSGNGKKQ